MEEGARVKVLIISGACCSPNLSAADDQARAALARIATEESVPFEVHLVPITTVALGALPRALMERLRGPFERSGRALPGVVVDGEPACFGPIDEERVRSQLIQARSRRARRTHDDIP